MRNAFASETLWAQTKLAYKQGLHLSIVVCYKLILFPHWLKRSVFIFQLMFLGTLFSHYG